MPEVLGLGTTTCTPSLSRSGQSFRPLGLPLRTMNTVAEVNGALLFGRRVTQSCGTNWPLSAKALMSVAMFMVITSAGRPSITERACLLEPPKDICRAMFSLCSACQCFWKALL
ncbi:hypothetical protein D9M73_289700 [compost metagenome]